MINTGKTRSGRAGERHGAVPAGNAGLGVLIVDESRRIAACDPAALHLLGLSRDPVGQSVEVACASSNLKLLPGPDPFSAMVSLEGGRTAEIRISRLGNGASALVIKSAARTADYRTVFENSVYGIYRDTLDGRPVRCNPALAALNGYTSEVEYIEAVTTTGGNWYVNPDRAVEFRRLIERDGRVKDLVSEVYRHRTREKIWITENAWYVRDGEGNPLFIEGTIQDATERVKGIEAIEQRANTDALTGAASRFRFLNELAAETRPDKAGCVLYTIDLDRFKEVNDLLGHGAGDIVLKSVAERLQAIAGRSGLVARLGGDEFAILRSGHHCHIEADSMGLRIVEALRQPVAVDGHNVILGASVGIAVYPAHAASAKELLTNADLALYQVKTGGRNDFRIFDHELKINLQKRKTLEGELRAAISTDQLELYYQPVVEAMTGRIVSIEALMRWNHPWLGLLLPTRFIPLAEEAGLMSELGNWAIHKACAQAATLPADIAIAVNVSPNQFRSAGILSAVREALSGTGLSPKRLILEVTESVILSSEAIAANVLGQLQQLGVQLALDDFGTGYSSLSYLQRFAFTTVKIDRSFVAGIAPGSANLAIVRAIIGMCKELGIKVIAEGIETDTQAALLQAESCCQLQGYYFSRPKPFAEITAELNSTSPSQMPASQPMLAISHT